MMVDLREVRSVTDFQRNLKDYVGQLKEKKNPLVLTVNGRAELIVQDAGSYQALLDRLEHAETVAAIRQGIEHLNVAKESPCRRLREGFGRNMASRVEIAPRAFDDLDEMADYIRRNGSFKQAEDWFNGIIAAIRTLEHMPSRCPIADESEDVGQQVRVLLHGKRNRRYKVYYAIQESGPSTGTVRLLAPKIRLPTRRLADTRSLRPAPAGLKACEELALRAAESRAPPYVGMNIVGLRASTRRRSFPRRQESTSFHTGSQGPLLRPPAGFREKFEKEQ